MSDDGFLARWSRRKQQAKRDSAGQPSEQADAAPAADDTRAPDQGLSSEGGGEGSDELSPEELASLPRIEDLTPESDIRVFMRGGVPKALRNAALRRMWVLDPAIRDYVGDARDYAYDWNVAGGVPGTGPLLPTDDPAALIERLFSSADSTARAGENRVADQQDASGENVPSPAANAAAEDPHAEDESRLTVPAADSGIEELQPDNAAPATADQSPEKPAPLPRKRHGGAIPT